MAPDPGALQGLFSQGYRQTWLEVKAGAFTSSAGW